MRRRRRPGLALDNGISAAVRRRLDGNCFVTVSAVCMLINTRDNEFQARVLR
jgi:hypothetical protein